MGIVVFSPVETSWKSAGITSSASLYYLFKNPKILAISAPSTNCGPSDPFVPWSDLARDHQSETELGTSREQTQTFCSKPTFGAEQSHYCGGKPTIQSQSERFIFQLQQTGEREPERGENYKLDRFQVRGEEHQDDREQWRLPVKILSQICVSHFPFFHLFFFSCGERVLIEMSL